jgi:hypothetical protein
VAISCSFGLAVLAVASFFAVRLEHSVALRFEALTSLRVELVGLEQRQQDRLVAQQSWIGRLLLLFGIDPDPWALATDSGLTVLSGPIQGLGVLGDQETGFASPPALWMQRSVEMCQWVEKKKKNKNKATKYSHRLEWKASAPKDARLFDDPRLPFDKPNVLNPTVDLPVSDGREWRADDDREIVVGGVALSRPAVDVLISEASAHPPGESPPSLRLPKPTVVITGAWSTPDHVSQLHLLEHATYSSVLPNDAERAGDVRIKYVSKDPTFATVIGAIDRNDGGKLVAWSAPNGDKLLLGRGWNPWQKEVGIEDLVSNAEWNNAVYSWVMRVVFTVGLVVGIFMCLHSIPTTCRCIGPMLEDMDDEPMFWLSVPIGVFLSTLLVAFSWFIVLPTFALESLLYAVVFSLVLLSVWRRSRSARSESSAKNGKTD